VVNIARGFDQVKSLPDSGSDKTTRKSRYSEVSMPSTHSDSSIPTPLRAGAKELAGLLRVPCGGRRRRDGQPCEALSVPGKRRCKWHGGFSTGPRTPEGIARVTANLPSRQSA
jgi:hypothetical protein